MRRPDADDLTTAPSESLSERLYAELYCLGLAFVFHDGNNHVRKALTLLLFLVWGAVTVGLSFESVGTVQPPFYPVMTGIVFLIIGRMWNIEVNNFAGLRLGDERSGDDEEE